MIDTILDGFRDALGADFTAYRNHCRRVARFCRQFLPDASADDEKIAVAAAFHDLGIWTAGTWDYLEPSVALARAYLVDCGRENWCGEISESIAQHHKLTPVKGSPWPIVEALRRADLADVSCGVLRSGLSADVVRTIRSEYPGAGFHLRLVQLGCAGALRRPTRPLPMMRW
jgi:hypothetical protein